MDELKEVVREIVKRLSANENISIHCYHGVDRTGTVIACLAKEILGMDGNSAIDFVNKFIPGAVGPLDYKNLVMEF